jgi:hypothetical protein
MRWIRTAFPAAIISRVSTLVDAALTDTSSVTAIKAENPAIARSTACRRGGVFSRGKKAFWEQKAAFPPYGGSDLRALRAVKDLAKLAGEQEENHPNPA